MTIRYIGIEVNEKIKKLLKDTFRNVYYIAIGITSVVIPIKTIIMRSFEDSSMFTSAPSSYSSYRHYVWCNTICNTYM